jgi:hypothetical protein
LFLNRFEFFFYRLRNCFRQMRIRILCQSRQLQ